MFGVTVANPRITALASPVAFDPDVLRRVLESGQKKHNVTMAESAGMLGIDAEKAEQMVKGRREARLVIHFMYPRFCELESKGYDSIRLQGICEPEYYEILDMMKKAVS